MRKPPRLREAGGDLVALDRAAEAFFEEGYAYQVNQRELDDTPKPLRAEALREMLPEREEAAALYLWLRYLVWLDSIREYAPPLTLTSLEVQGLALLSRARNRFQRTHPPCVFCGMPNSDWELSCHSCLKEIKR